MATATPRIVEVEKIQLVKVEEQDGVTLELTNEEAQFLFDLLYCGVTGSNRYSRRQHSDDIHKALQAAGCKETDRPLRDFKGTVNFAGGAPEGTYDW